MSRRIWRASFSDGSTVVFGTIVSSAEKEARQILRLIDALEENDDVQDVYSNFDISEELLEAVAG